MKVTAERLEALERAVNQIERSINNPKRQKVLTAARYLRQQIQQFREWDEDMPDTILTTSLNRLKAAAADVNVGPTAIPEIAVIENVTALNEMPNEDAVPRSRPEPEAVEIPVLSFVAEDPPA